MARPGPRRGVLNLNLPVLLILFCLLENGAGQGGGGQEWEASNYPNPTADGYAKCNMKSPANICDPDGVLTESERYRVNYELNQLESRTRQPQAKHVRGGSENAVKMMANDILRKWTLDKQCMKSLVIVVSTEDKKFWVARDNRVPVYAAEFTDIFTAQKPLFKDGNYPQALLNIIESTWDKALAKQSQVPPDSRGEPFTPSDRGGKHPPSDKGGSGFSMPKIPMWFWLGLIFIIIPTLCCCCCLYFCCCRRKGAADGGASNKRQGPSDLPDEEYGGNRPAPRRGFGGGGGMQNLIGGIGAGAIGNTVSNWFRNRNAGGGGAGGGQSPPPATGGYGDYVPPGQKAGGGRAMYPSAEVKDEGGGGGW
uniref:TPM domain-containing protein n=1 Tax=Ditylenchus dipsaci TaxID=166011 RepID=A0A915EIE0_9BILA